MTETTTMALNKMEKRYTQQAEEARRRAVERAEAEKRQEAEKNAQAVAQRQQETAEKAQEKRLLTPECKFWWQQHDQAPSEKTAQKKAQHCEA
ncbi:hypothetical protein [Azotobacter beijerinckii]|uniref:hypothetical protein n=1 Tax=Azotobacter beijerinckii TaxID=170623 RepID=UPI0011602E67|nr:hypothetical protein [Azotobacter beijerinckii]